MRATITVIVRLKIFLFGRVCGSCKLFGLASLQPNKLLCSQPEMNETLQAD